MVAKIRSSQVIDYNFIFFTLHYFVKCRWEQSTLLIQNNHKEYAIEFTNLKIKFSRDIRPSR